LNVGGNNIGFQKLITPHFFTGFSHFIDAGNVSAGAFGYISFRNNVLIGPEI
jgi:hypothetical protein